MTIYLAHSASYNFVEELYEPIRQSELSKQHTFIFPHEGEVVDSKESLAKCDLVIAEVSLSSTGLGIELGWANDLKKNIVCLHKNGTKPSRSLKFICQTFVPYATNAELISNIASLLKD